MNARTKNGGNPLWWAEEYHPPAHPAVSLLRHHTPGAGGTIDNSLPAHTGRQHLPHKYCQVRIYQYEFTTPLDLLERFDCLSP